MDRSAIEVLYREVQMHQQEEGQAIEQQNFLRDPEPTFPKQLVLQVPRIAKHMNIVRHTHAGSRTASPRSVHECMTCWQKIDWRLD